MTVGFKEDSPFYDGPVIDTREDVNATKKEESVVVQDKKEIEVEEKVVIEDKKQTEPEEEIIQKEKILQEPETKEGETTFSYERDDD